jgi:aryl-alcohol dehydrogenase-like predicted oxidoreductase
LGKDQGLGALVWSPLGWGRLTGKIRRGQPLPEGSRLHETAELRPACRRRKALRIVDALDEMAAETGKTVPQIALNWLTSRPDRLLGDHRRPQRGAAAPESRRYRLVADDSEQIARLDKASAVTAPYPHFPYHRQEGFARLNPPLV